MLFLFEFIEKGCKNVNSYQEIWEVVLNYCKEKLNDVAYKMWIEPMKLINIEADRVIIAVQEFKIKLIMERIFP